MTRLELRLELVRIVHHPNQSDTLTAEIVRKYEASLFNELLDEPPTEAKPAPAKKPRA